MKKNLQTKATSVMILALFAAISTLNLKAGNLLVDPGFENQTPAAQGGWLSFGGFFSLDYAHNGIRSMFVPTDFGVPGAFQQFPAAPGSKWQLTGYGLTASFLQGSLGLIQFTFFDSSGHDLGTVETSGNQFPAKTSNPIDATSTPLVWTRLDTGIATAPAGTAYVQAFVIFINFTGIAQGVYFDDLDLEVLGVTHGQYVESIIKNALTLKANGLITGTTALDMVKAATQSAGGK